MKTVIITLSLLVASCGRDDSNVSPETTPTVAAPTTTDSGTSVQPGQEEVAIDGRTQAAGGQRIAPPPADSAAVNHLQSAYWIVRQAFETNKWKFDITQDYKSYTNRTDDLKFMKSLATVYKKVNNVTYTCLFRMTVFISDSAPVGSWATIMLEAGPSVGINTSNQPVECKASTIQYVYFKVSDQCQGYNQQTYVCGKNISNDLIEF